jgi:carboxymethylenebutenolidase
MRPEALDGSFLAVPDGAGPFPGLVVIHEASGLNANIKDVCRRLSGEGYVAMGVDLFEDRNRAVCMARMLAGGLAGNLDHYGVPALKEALGALARRPEVDADRLGAVVRRGAR